MTENKRFKLAFENFDGWAICDTTGEYSDDEDYIDWLSGQKAVDVLNHFAEENEQLKSELSEKDIQLDFLKSENKHMRDLVNENEQLKKELHLMHMRTMFSTVQSFKGDVSKRYRYLKETDTIYDTANHYGQYDKVLDKAEIVMLLNEYETVLNELKGDGE